MYTCAYTAYAYSCTHMHTYAHTHSLCQPHRVPRPVLCPSRLIDPEHSGQYLGLMSPSGNANGMQSRQIVCLFEQLLSFSSDVCVCVFKVSMKEVFILSSVTADRVLITLVTRV